MRVGRLAHPADIGAHGSERIDPTNRASIYGAAPRWRLRIRSRFQSWPFVLITAYVDLQHQTKCVNKKREIAGKKIVGEFGSCVNKLSIPSASSQQYCRKVMPISRGDLACGRRTWLALMHD
jgi:hypothetical protein